MFGEYKLFRMVIDEVERTLCQVDLEIAKEFANLVADDKTRTEIFEKIQTELQLTKDMVQLISGGAMVAERFPQYRRRLARRLETLNRVSREQVLLLRQLRATGGEDVREALLMSINCAAAGLGATG
jgi:phosphoenolpyruvate carboxylase